MAKAVSPEERRKKIFEEIMDSLKKGEFHGEEKDRILLEGIKRMLDTRVEEDANG